MKRIYELSNKKGIKLYVSNVGAGIFDITINRNNKEQSIILHPKNVDDFFFSKDYFGKPCGRTAGRITGSSFVLNNVVYHIENDLPYDVLHGGTNGISFKEFNEVSLSNNSITLHYLSKDMESGYPGDLDIEITYTINEDNEIEIIHKYKSNKDTLCNLTSHLYFNLSNNVNDTILNHELMIDSDLYGKLDKDNVPIALEKVDDAFSFNKMHKIKDHLFDEEVQKNLGYNHPYILNHQKDYDAILKNEDTKIEIAFKSTYDTLQFYTCNYPSNTIMNNDRSVNRYDAVCLEFQHFPNGINSSFISNKKDICKKDVLHIEKTTLKIIF